MYTKTGLGLLAAAGLTFGMIGMHAGGASPTTPPCASTSTANGAAGAGGASADANGSLAPTGPVGPDGSVGQDGNGNPTGGDQNGNANGNGGDNGGNGPGTTPTTQPGNGGTSGQGSVLVIDGNGHLGDNGTGPVSVGTNGPSSGADNTFLNVDGTTDGFGAPGGDTASPPANLRAVGRSAYLSRLLQLWARANASH